MKLHITLTLLLLALAGNIFAQQVGFSYQGMLLDAAKQVVSGEHIITVKLYDSPTEGTALHSENFTTHVNDGIFSLTIGSQVALSESVKFDKQYWLGISVDNGEEMLPRTALTSVPNAIHAVEASSLATGGKGAVTSLNGVSGDLEFKGGPGTFVETDGKTITITSMPVGGQETQATDWHETGGNAVGATAYLGTNNNSVLTLAVKNVGTTTTVNNSVRLNTNWSVQRDANGNARGASAVDLQSDRSADSQVASGGNSVIGGGERNTSSGDWSTTAGGYVNEAGASYAAIGGGYNNRVTAELSTIAGGSSNLVTGQYANVGGGRRNAATADYASVGGGFEDTASATYATIGGGHDNNASGFASTASGGTGNETSNYYTSVGGGQNNIASGYAATVSGGTGNETSNYYTSVGGGQNNIASGYAATVSGGTDNEAGGFNATIGGGFANIAVGDRSTIPGGTELVLSSSADRSFGFNANNALSTADMTINASNTVVFGNANLWLANTDGSAQELRFYEAQSSPGDFPAAGTNYTAFKAQAQSRNVTYILPAADGTNGQLLSTNGSGVLGWTTPPIESIDWHETGGNSAGESSFVGTNNNAVLRMHVKDGETLNNSLILNNNWSIQRDPDGNARGAYAVDEQVDRGGPTDVASGDYATISGGNWIEASGDHATAGGGYGHYVTGNYATVAGGSYNNASGNHAAIGGGSGNNASGKLSFVAGGGYDEDYGWGGHTASGLASAIVGGFGHSTQGDYAFIGGGDYNSASGLLATVAGGTRNNASGNLSFIGGGGFDVNYYYGGHTASGNFSTIVGGFNNTAGGDYSAIPGGRSLTLTSSAARSFGFNANNADGTAEMAISAPNTAVFGNADLWLANTDGTARELRFYEAQGSAGDFPAAGINYTAFNAQAQSANITYTLPASLPASNGALASTSTGALSWASHGSVAASNGATQTINDAAVTASSTIIVTIEGTVTFAAVTARTAGTSFTITTGAALTTSDVINYQILP